MKKSQRPSSAAAIRRSNDREARQTAADIACFEETQSRPRKPRPQSAALARTVSIQDGFDQITNTRGRPVSARPLRPASAASRASNRQRRPTSALSRNSALSGASGRSTGSFQEEKRAIALLENQQRRGHHKQSHDEQLQLFKSQQHARPSSGRSTATTSASGRAVSPNGRPMMSTADSACALAVFDTLDYKVKKEEVKTLRAQMKKPRVCASEGLKSKSQLKLESTMEAQQVQEHRGEFTQFVDKIDSKDVFREFQTMKKELDDLQWALANPLPGQFQQDSDSEPEPEPEPEDLLALKQQQLLDSRARAESASSSGLSVSQSVVEEPEEQTPVPPPSARSRAWELRSRMQQCWGGPGGPLALSGLHVADGFRITMEQAQQMAAQGSAEAVLGRERALSAHWVEDLWLCAGMWLNRILSTAAENPLLEAAAWDELQGVHAQIAMLQELQSGPGPSQDMLERLVADERSASAVVAVCTQQIPDQPSESAPFCCEVASKLYRPQGAQLAAQKGAEHCASNPEAPFAPERPLVSPQAVARMFAKYASSGELMSSAELTQLATEVQLIPHVFGDPGALLEPCSDQGCTLEQLEKLVLVCLERLPEQGLHVALDLWAHQMRAPGPVELFAEPGLLKTAQRKLMQQLAVGTAAMDANKKKLEALRAAQASLVECKGRREVVERILAGQALEDLEVELKERRANSTATEACWEHALAPDFERMIGALVEVEAGKLVRGGWRDAGMALEAARVIATLRVEAEVNRIALLCCMCDGELERQRHAKARSQAEAGVELVGAVEGPLEAVIREKALLKKAQTAKKRNQAQVGWTTALFAGERRLCEESDVGEEDSAWPGLVDALEQKHCGPGEQVGDGEYDLWFGTEEELAGTAAEACAHWAELLLHEGAGVLSGDQKASLGRLVADKAAKARLSVKGSLGRWELKRGRSSVVCKAQEKSQRAWRTQGMRAAVQGWRHRLTERSTDRDALECVRASRAQAQKRVKQEQAWLDGDKSRVRAQMHLTSNLWCLVAARRALGDLPWMEGAAAIGAVHRTLECLQCAARVPAAADVQQRAAEREAMGDRIELLKLISGGELSVSESRMRVLVDHEAAQRECREHAAAGWATWAQHKQQLRWMEPASEKLLRASWCLESLEELRTEGLGSRRSSMQSAHKGEGGTEEEATHIVELQRKAAARLLATAQRELELWESESGPEDSEVCAQHALALIESVDERLGFEFFGS